MLAELGVDSLEALTKDTVPGAILREPFLQTGEPQTEREALARLKDIAKRTKFVPRTLVWVTTTP